MALLGKHGSQLFKLAGVWRRWRWGMDRPAEWIDPHFDLVRVDRNASAIMAAVRKALREAGNDGSVIDTYLNEAQSGDYDHLLEASMFYAGMLE